MFRDTKAFSSFSVNDIQKAKQFYGETLGLEIKETKEGLALKIAGGGDVFLYSKPNHQPASFTVLNFPVENIDNGVAQLNQLGITFEHYDYAGLKTDDDGILRSTGDDGGPNIAWFKDPAGNILSILEEN